MPAPSTSTPKRRVWHYVPFGNRRTEDAIAFVDSLALLLQPWIAAARAGEKRHGLEYQADLQTDAKGYETTRQTLQKSDHDLRCNLAAALTVTKEWDGYLVARELSYLLWPSDAELVQIIHRWSCELKRTSVARWKAKKELTERKSA